MGFKSLVLITLVAGFVLVRADAKSESLESLLRSMLSRELDQTKANADALLQIQKINAGHFGYTVLRGVVIGSNGEAVSSTDTEFALKLSPMEGSRIASAFTSGRFNAFTANSVISAEGVTYQMMAEEAQAEGKANARAANGQILHMSKVDSGVVSVIILDKIKNE